MKEDSTQRKILNSTQYALELADISTLSPEEVANFYKNICTFPLGESGLELSMKLFKSKWVVPIFTRLMRYAPMRYGELKRSLSEYGITNHTLSKTLDEMECDLLIDRKVYPGTLPIVEYSLTDHAIEFLPIMAAFSSWTRKHFALIEERQQKKQQEES